MRVVDGESLFRLIVGQNTVASPVSEQPVAAVQDENRVTPQQARAIVQYDVCVSDPGFVYECMEF